MDWLTKLADAEDASARRRLLSRRKRTLPVDAPAQLHAAVLDALYLDLPKASRLADAGCELADLEGSRLARAFAERSQGHVSYLKGEYESAGARYRSAVDLFHAEGDELEVGRTLSSGLQALSYQGSYDLAEQWAQRAGAIFERHGDVLRLARLDSNVGNIYFRHDRPADALVHYHRALEGFEQCGEPRDSAAAFSNLAVCSTSLGRFRDARDFYEKAREHCAAHGLIALAARADYNIAYLYFLRGEYNEARRLYQVTRDRCALAGDHYHAALCDLDEAELYLELNLTREGELLAQRASRAFAQLKMPYEQAKALVNLAVALSQRGSGVRADAALRRARSLFARENNAVWPALIDQLRAVLAFHAQRFERAHRLSSGASRALADAAIPGRAALSEILLARLWLRAGYPDRARLTGREALERPGAESSPVLRFHARLVEGEIHEAQGRLDQARAAYESARRGLEDMRGRLDTEDLRISVLTDKLAVYESLVTLHLDRGTSEARAEAMDCVQQAKSRSLADRLGASWCGRPPEEGAPLPELRKDLEAVTRQLESAELAAPGRARQRAILRERAAALEAELAQAPESLPATSLSWTAAQVALHDSEALLEYYEARGVLYVFVLSRRELRVVRLGPAAPVRQALKLLQFQLGKLRFQQDSRERAQTPEVAHHLRSLGDLLIGPAEETIRAFRHLFVAPHRMLHSLPFGALHDGNNYLIDRFSLSFVPSAAVFAVCRQPRPATLGDAVVLAVADERAPRVAEEAEAVARILGGAKMFLGDLASKASFALHAPAAGILHLAAHGLFRADNPMFSAIQLADGDLTMMDLSQTRLSAELLTLSACNSGSHLPVGGDELLGLIRGCLSSGARRLLVTLWEIDDRSALAFMTSFYGSIKKGVGSAESLGRAAREIRLRFPHPYHWAPFMLVGDPGPVKWGRAE